MRVSPVIFCAKGFSNARICCIIKYKWVFAPFENKRAVHP